MPKYAKILIGAAMIALAALAVYWPSLGGEFIIDDDLLLTDNELVKAPDGLGRIWFSTEPVDYWPLTNTSFWIEWRLWEMNPTGYHVTNLLLHIAAALLIWAILNRLAIPGAWLAALLFTIHPVNVESVAWISQRKNTLAMVFFLLSILWYLKAEPTGDDQQRFTRPRGQFYYWLALLGFVLAMLSKGSVATLPVILLLLAWWQRGTLTRWDAARSAPLFLVAVVLVAVNVWFQTHGSGGIIRIVTFEQRLLGAAGVIWFYLGKALWPVNLIFVYPQWQVRPDEFGWWLPLAAAIVVTLLLIWQRNTRFGRPLFAAWMFFCLALAPVMGFTDVGFMRFSLVADRYQHIAIIAVIALVAAVCHQLVQRYRAVVILPVAMCGALAWLAWQQSAPYSDPLRLYRTTLEKNPNTWWIHNKLAMKLYSLGQVDEAHKELQRALEAEEVAEVHNNMGNLLTAKGDFEGAVAHFKKSIDLAPYAGSTYQNMAYALLKAGRPQEAIDQYQQAIQLKFDSVAMRHGLAQALSQVDRFEEAIPLYEEVLRWNHDDVEAREGLARAKKETRQFQDAVGQYRELLRLKPKSAEAHLGLAESLAGAREFREAIDGFRMALELQPESALAHHGLGKALSAAGRTAEAIERFQEATRLQPDMVEPHANLAAALDREGRSDEAVASAQRALELAQQSGQTTLAAEIELRLKLYRSRTK